MYGLTRSGSDVRRKQVLPWPLLRLAGRAPAATDRREAACRRQPGSQPPPPLWGRQVSHELRVGGRGRARAEMSLTGPRPEEKLSQGERNVGIPLGSGSGFTPG